jgi:phosphoglycolate phosphatase
METAGLAPYFDFIASGDTFSEMKPSPIPLLETAKKIGVDPEKTWMIGDSINDISAGNQADFKTVAVSYGYAGQYTMADLNATYTLNSLPELVALIQNEI